jgi:hypothetical protein
MKLIEPEKKKDKIPFNEYITYNFSKKFTLFQYTDISIYSENKKINKKLRKIKNFS